MNTIKLPDATQRSIKPLYDLYTKADPAIPRGTETILLVDNNPATRDYAAWILRELGYYVIATADGNEALCLFHQNPDRHVDLLIGDATMPRIGGKQLIHLIAAFLPKSRMVLTSFYPAELAVHNNLLDAELAYIQKPVTRQTLAVKVRMVLDAAKQQEDQEAARGERLVFASVEELEKTAVL